MTRYILILSSLCSLFVMSWVLSRWFSPPNCINSTVVSKVVILPEHDELTLCTPEVRLMGPLVPQSAQQMNLIERVEKLERVSAYLPQTELEIRVYTQQKNMLVIQGPRVFISRDLVSVPGQLERAILFSALNEGEPFVSSVLADFFVSELIVRTPLEAARPWPTYLKSLKNYCRSNDVLVAHKDYCTAQNELRDSFIVYEDSNNTGSDPVPWALAPVYTQVLRTIYRVADLEQKKEMLEHLSFLGEMDGAFFDSIQRWRDPKLTESSFFKHIRDWLMPAMLPIDLVDQAVAEFSIFKTKYKFISVARTSRSYYPLESDPNANFEPVVTQLGTKVAFFPSDVWLGFDEMKVLSQAQLQNFIMLSCRLPEVANLTQYAEQVSRIVYLKNCDRDQIDWADLRSMDLGEFFAKYKENQFVEFNLSALSLAERVRGPLPDSTDFSAWQRWLMWQKVFSDEKTEILRPLSAIDGVTRYRF